MNIRDATLDDLADITAIYNHSIPGRMATADTEPVTVQSRIAWFESHAPATRPLWVAEIAGEIAGYLSFRNFYGRPAYHITCELGLYVHPDFHRRGVGSALLARGIERAPSLGLENMLAFIFAHNEPSIQLFERRGFTRWGFLPGLADLDGRRVDLAILGRKV